jgi:hypothetical protein
MKTITTALALVAALALGATACNKDKKEGEKGKASASKVTGKASAGPIVMGAAQFHKDYTSLTGPQVMNKYMGKKVRITGPVLRTMDMGEYGGYQIWLQASGKKHVAVKFKDDGAAAKGKGLKKGAGVTVQCSIGGMMGQNIHLIDCDLRG